MEAHKFEPKEIRNDEEIRAWDKQPWETKAQWEGFKAYRDLGALRSIAKAAGVHYQCPNNKPKPSQVDTMKRWSRANHWVERCRLYDEHLETLRLLAAEEAAREIGETHSGEVRELMEILLAPARAFKERVTEEVQYHEGEEPTFAEALQQTDMSLKDLWGLAVQGAKVYSTVFSAERVTHGLPTSIAERKVDQRTHHSGHVEQRHTEREQLSERLRGTEEGRQAITGILRAVRGGRDPNGPGDDEPADNGGGA